MVENTPTLVGAVDSEDEGENDSRRTTPKEICYKIVRPPESPLNKPYSIAFAGEFLDAELGELLEDAVEEGEPDQFHEAIASAFAKAERMLADSHQKALNVIKKCRQEVHIKEKSNRDLQKQVALLEKGSRHNSSVNKTLSVGMARNIKRTNTTTSNRSWLGRPGSQRDETKSSWTPSALGNKIAEFGRARNWGRNSSTSERPQADRDPSGSPSLSGAEDPVSNDEDSVDAAVEPCAPPLFGPSSSKSSDDIKAPSESQLLQMSLPIPQEERKTESNEDRSNLHESETESSPPARGQIQDSFEKGGADEDTMQRRPSVVSNNSKNSHKLELLPQWSQPAKRSKKKKLGGLSRTMTSESLGTTGSMTSTVESVKPCCWCSRMVLDPNASPRASWDIGSIVLVVYDMVMIPLQLFELPDSPFTMFMSWTTRLFWSADIFMSFSTGVLKRDGQIEYKLSVIACHYLKTWFAVDFFIVAIDWIEVLWSEGSFLGFARAGKASRTFRIIRMVRLLRLARVRNILSALFERIESEQLSILAGIVSIMLVIVGLSHIIACVWYGLAVEDRPDTWLKVHNFADASLEYKYTTALHWSLLQFAGGTDEIVPQNTSERVYAVAVFILAFVLASVFVGRLTSSMTQLHMLSKKDVEKFQVLKRYLTKHAISHALALRVIHNAQHALSETQRFMEEGRVELLTLISEPLRVELHFELYAPVLTVHPFFSRFCEACSQVMKKICHSAMSQLLVSAGDVVFMPGEVPSPPQMFIVCSGDLSYHYMSGAIAYVEVGYWISEATLWTNWIHQGMLKASSDCRLCRLDAAKFQDITSKFEADFDIRKYARAFISSINSGEMELSDLPYQDTVDEINEAFASYDGGTVRDNVFQTPTPTGTPSTPAETPMRCMSGVSHSVIPSQDGRPQDFVQTGSTGSYGGYERRRSVFMVNPLEEEKQKKKKGSWKLF